MVALKTMSFWRHIVAFRIATSSIPSTSSLSVYNTMCFSRFYHQCPDYGGKISHVRLRDARLLTLPRV